MRLVGTVGMSRLTTNSSWGEGGQHAVDQKLAGDAGKSRGVDGAHRLLQGIAAAGVEKVLHKTVADRVAVAGEDRVGGQVAEREVLGLDAAGRAAAAAVEGLLEVAPGAGGEDGLPAAVLHAFQPQPAGDFSCVDSHGFAFRESWWW